MEEQARPPKKFTLFKNNPFAAPSWPTPKDEDNEDNDEDFFSRSKHTYAVLAAEEEERKKRKQQEATSSSTQPTFISPTTPPRKKRKSSVGPETTRPLRSPQQSSASQSHLSLKPVQNAHKSPAKIPKEPAHQQHESKKTGKAPVLQIDSDDDEDDCGLIITSGTPSKPSQTLETLPTTSFSQTSSLDALPKPVSSLSPEHDTTSFQTGNTSATPSPTMLTNIPLMPPSLIHDPKISILVVSSIQGTSPLIVLRNLSQRLKEVRIEWCYRQNFPEGITSEKIVLTWRGKRVYDSTSCRGLGIGTDGDGNVVGEGEKDLFGIGHKRIYMEAMTEEMLQRAKEVRLKLKGAQADERNEGEDGTVKSGENSQEVLTQQKLLRIIMRSRGYEELKFKIKPTETVSRLINEFRQRRGVPEENSVAVHFDGEELSEESTVESYDIDDMDTLDVYVR